MSDRKITLAVAAGAFSGAIAGFYAGKVAAKEEAQEWSDGIHIRPQDLIQLPFADRGDETTSADIDTDVGFSDVADELDDDEVGAVLGGLGDLVSDFLAGGEFESNDTGLSDDWEPNTEDYTSPRNPAPGTPAETLREAKEDGLTPDEAIARLKDRHPTATIDEDAIRNNWDGL